MYGLHFRDELDEATAREFDALIAKLKGFLLAEHNEDGTHQFDLSNISADSLRQVIDAAQSSGQWWKTGPWKLDDPTAAEPNKAGAIPPKITTGTYDNYAPNGIDDCVVLELEPDGGDVTLNGLRALDGVNTKRLLMLRNRDSANNLILAHEATTSIAQYRFDNPDGEDIEMAPGQNVWLYYDPNRNGGRWTAAITGQTNGPLSPGTVTSGPSGSGGAGSAWLEETVSIPRTSFNSWSATPITLVAAVAGKVIIPHCLLMKGHFNGVAYTSSISVSLRYNGNTTDLITSGSIITSTGASRLTTTPNTSGQAFTLATFDPSNKALVLRGSADTNVGDGHANDRIEVKLLYYLAEPV